MHAGRLPDFPFRRSAHDRLAERRKDADFLDAAWRDPASKVLVMQGHDLAVDDETHALRFIAPDAAPSGQRMLLGAVDGVTHLLLLADTPFAAAPPAPSVPSAALTGSFSSLRTLVPGLRPEELSLAVHAISLGGWHRRHPMCAVCGEATEVIEAGAARRCLSCSTTHFPRTDPAVIMLVVDDEDRCLLGHNAARAAGWFSTLAGFVEPGESPEQAVVREVWEEAGIEVGEVSYAGSQPWPFPSSLMLGFFAHAATHTISVDGEEITEARWFTRELLRTGLEAGELTVPTPVSIAGALLTSWYGEDLPPNRTS